MNFQQLPPTTHNNPAKYKTMLCKHFSSPKGCSFGDKCQFAHGMSELRNSAGGGNSLTSSMRTQPKRGPNPQNYKIVKCKYFERDGTCRYGTLCSFAHGDAELRKKSDNIMMQGGDMMVDPMAMYMKNPYMPGPFDPNFMVPGVIPPMGGEGMMDTFMGMQGMNGINMNHPAMGLFGMPPNNPSMQRRNNAGTDNSPNENEKEKEETKSDDK